MANETQLPTAIAKDGAGAINAGTGVDTASVKSGGAWQQVTFAPPKDNAVATAAATLQQILSLADQVASKTAAAAGLVERSAVLYGDLSTAATKAAIATARGLVEALRVSVGVLIADVPYGLFGGPKPNGADFTKSLSGYLTAYGNTTPYAVPGGVRGGGSGLYELVSQSLQDPNDPNVPYLSPSTSVAGLHVVIAADTPNIPAIIEQVWSLLDQLGEAWGKKLTTPLLTPLCRPTELKTRYDPDHGLFVRWRDAYAPNAAGKTYPATVNRADDSLPYKVSLEYAKQPARYEVQVAAPGERGAVPPSRDYTTVASGPWDRLFPSYGTQTNHVLVPQRSVIALDLAPQAYVRVVYYYPQGSVTQHWTSPEGVTSTKPAREEAVSDPVLVTLGRTAASEGVTPDWIGTGTNNPSPLDLAANTLEEILDELEEGLVDGSNFVAGAARTTKDYADKVRRVVQKVDAIVQLFAALAKLRATAYVREFYVTADGTSSAGLAAVQDEYRKSLAALPYQNPTDFVFGCFFLATGPGADASKVIGLYKTLLGLNSQLLSGLEAAGRDYVSLFNALTGEDPRDPSSPPGPTTQISGTTGQALVGADDTGTLDLNCPPPRDLSTLTFDDNLNPV